MKTIQVICMATVWVLLSLGKVIAATISSTPVGGLWNAGSTWVGGIVPRADDLVIIAENATVLLGTSSNGISGLNINPGGSLIASNSNAVLNISGQLINNGNLRLYVNETIKGKLFLRGDCIWSGSGIWEINELNLTTYNLEFDGALLINFHETIRGTTGLASLNLLDNPDITFNFRSSGNDYTIAAEQDRFKYGHISLDMRNGTLNFYSYGTDTLQMNQIQISGNIHLENNSFINVGNCNILTIQQQLTGLGQFRGSNTSDIVVNGSDLAPTFYMYPNSNFRKLIVNRPSGLILGNSFRIIHTLQLNNSAILQLPKRYNNPSNSIFTLGSNGLGPGYFLGNGFLQTQSFVNIYDMPDVNIYGNAPEVKLRFVQSGQSNQLHDLVIDKVDGKVVMDENCDLKVRNDFTLNHGQLEIGNNTLLLSGQIKSMNTNGSFTGSPNSRLIIDKEVSQANATIFFTQSNADSRSLKTLRQSRNGTISLGNSLEIFDEMELSGTSANIFKTNNFLILKSTADRTARIGNLGTSLVTDSVIVERFIKGGTAERRNYRLLSSPVHHRSVNSIPYYYFSRLQDAMLITGPGGNLNGFDASPSNGSTILLYKEQTPGAAKQHFVSLTNIHHDHQVSQSAAAVGNGFFLFFRGDRINHIFNKTSPPFPIPEDVTIRYKGLLNQGEIKVTGLDAENNFLAYTEHNEDSDGSNLLGNPYPSTIDWELADYYPGAPIELLNVSPSIYQLDPVTRTYGVYIKGGLSTGSASRYISSGQGFTVKAIAANPQITFRENAKVRPQPLPLLMRNGSMNRSKKTIRVSLHKDSINKDDIIIAFDENNQEIYDPMEDSLDMGGLNAQLDLSSLSADKCLLAINAQPNIAQAQDIPLSIQTSAAGEFLLNWKTSYMTQDYNIVLKDLYTGSIRNMADYLDYTFSVDKSDSLTYGSKRFYISINRKEQMEEPVKKVQLTHIFPNPANEYVYIPLPDEIRNAATRLIDINGKTVSSNLYTQTKSRDHIKMNISRLQAGAYIIQVTNERNGKLIYREKLIIQ
jgi:hypothetical protein